MTTCLTILTGLALLFGAQSTPPEADAPAPAPAEPELTSLGGLDGRLVAGRPLIRPGEWFPVLFEITGPDEGDLFLGPPDDGLNPLGGARETDTRIIWNTGEDQTFKLVPDLTSIQWPRRAVGAPAGQPLALPARIYIPVKVVSDTPLGPVDIAFTVEGFRSGADPGAVDPDRPVVLERRVTVEVVHPTDPEATNLQLEDPSLFFGWHGDLPDWTVQDARQSGPKKPAPALAWMVVFVPFSLVGLALVWAFATGRL